MLKLDKYDYFFLFFLVTASIFNVYLSFNLSLSPDEGTHLILSEFFRDLILNSWKLGFNIGKLSQFGINYLIHYPKLTITYLPMYHLNVAFLFLFNLSPVVGRLVSNLYFVLSSVLIYLISIEIFKNKKVGIISVLIFVLTPTAFSAISQASVDFTAYFFGFLTLFLFLKSVRTEKNFYYICSGISSFLLFFSRIFAIFPVLAIIFYLVLFEKKQKIKKILLVILPFMILFIPFIFFYSKIGGLSVSSIIIKEAEQVPWTRYDLLAPFYYFYYMGIQTYGLGIIVFLAAFFYFYREIKAKKNISINLFFVLWFIFTYLILTYLQNPRYVSYLLMPLIFGAGYYFSKIDLRYLTLFFLLLLVIVGSNSYQGIMNSKDFVNTEKEISRYLYDRGGNIGLLSEEPVYSSAFIYYISAFDANKTVAVYRPCFFTNFLNESKASLINEMSKNGIRSILVPKDTKNYGIIEDIGEYITLNKTFYAGNYTFEVYSTNFEQRQTQLCNYICVTGYYLCTNYTSPFDIS